METKKKIHYKVIKRGKIKSYVDKQFCYCNAHAEPHIHPKGTKSEVV